MRYFVVGCLHKEWNFISTSLCIDIFSFVTMVMMRPIKTHSFPKNKPGIKLQDFYVQILTYGSVKKNLYVIKYT